MHVVIFTVYVYVYHRVVYKGNQQKHANCLQSSDVSVIV